MDDRTEVELVYITIAPNREKIMKTFRNEETLRPMDIRKKTGMRSQVVTNNLKILRDKDYVYLTNPEKKKYRYYRLTEKGKKIVRLLE